MEWSSTRSPVVKQAFKTSSKKTTLLGGFTVPVFANILGDRVGGGVCLVGIVCFWTFRYLTNCSSRLDSTSVSIIVQMLVELTNTVNSTNITTNIGLSKYGQVGYL